MKYCSDDSNDDQWPKTLLIRNTVGGLIWQIYHVNNEIEADNLSRNAMRNGFYGRSLVDYMPEEEETWPDWRETATPDIFIEQKEE